MTWWMVIERYIKIVFSGECGFHSEALGFADVFPYGR